MGMDYRCGRKISKSLHFQMNNCILQTYLKYMYNWELKIKNYYLKIQKKIKISNKTKS